MNCSDCGADKKIYCKGLCAPCYYRHREAKNRLDPEWVAWNRARGRDYWKALRHETIMAYGGYRCACCGETEPMFLSLDHVNNDGASHRRSLGYGGNGKGASSRTLKWLKDNNFPEGFQVLCMNCNTGKQRNNGVCPHDSQHHTIKPHEFGEHLTETIPSQAAQAEGVTTRRKP